MNSIPAVALGSGMMVRSRADKNLAFAARDLQGAGRSMEPSLANLSASPLSMEQSRLEAVREFVAFSSRAIPLSWFLDGAPVRLARIFRCPVVSIYLLDADGRTLVMRGNTGFAPSVLGQVRLQCGEGLTGVAASQGSPIAVENASRHESYVAFPELDEAKYPVFMAVPLLAEDSSVGALVLQRSEGPFVSADVELATALSVSVSTAVRSSELALQSRMVTGPRRRAGGGTRRIILPGRPVVPGRALGALTAIRRPPRRALGIRADGDVDCLRKTFESTRRSIGALSDKAKELEAGNDAAFLSTYLEILADSRLKGRALEVVGAGTSIPLAMGQIAQEAVRTATHVTRDSFLAERARDIEDLCNAIAMMATSDPRATLPTKTVLMSDVLTVYDLLVTSRSHPVGVALTGRGGGPRTQVLLRLLGIPSILDVEGMFRWASDGDIALLDATHGHLLINPTRAEVNELRASRAQEG